MTTPRPDADTPAGGTVLPGPWSSAGGEEVTETEVLDVDDLDDSLVIDQDGQAVTPDAPARWLPALPIPRIGDGGVEAARTAGRIVVQVGQGHGVLAARAYRAATYGVIRDQIRSAAARGDTATAAEWCDRLEAAKNNRRQRITDLPGVLARAGVSAGIVALVIGAVIVTAAILVGVVHPFGVGWGDYWHIIGWAIRTAVTVATVLIPLAVTGTVPAWLILARRAGADGAIVPTLLVPGGHLVTTDTEITPSVVVTALRDLGISALTRAIRAMPDRGAGMLSPVTTAGCGVEVTVALPSGTSTAEIQDRHQKLAENMGRHEHELFISIPPAQARTVRLWAANSGALDEPIGPSPLVADPGMTASYRSGRAPWGQDLRGDATGLSLYQRHLLITGVSNQGKTAALRALELWLALDPTVEFWIADLKGAGDWEVFTGIADRLIQGPTDEHVAAATEMVEDAVVEMQRRIESKRSGGKWRPLIVIVDEAQVAFGCTAQDDDKNPYGGTKAKSRYFHAVKKVHDQGRVVDVLMHQGTQDPTNENLPKRIREGAHIRVALVLGTPAQSKMALGDKAFNGGAAPHRLRLGIDKGTVVVAGDGVPLPPGASSLTLRTHYINDDDAAMLADVARSRRAGTSTNAAVADQEPDRDVLADMLTVLGTAERMRTAVMLGKLIDLDERVYGDWSTEKIRSALTEHGSDTYKSSVMYVRADDIRAAITVRDEKAEGGE